MKKITLKQVRAKFPEIIHEVADKHHSVEVIDEQHPGYSVIIVPKNEWLWIKEYFFYPK